MVPPTLDRSPDILCYQVQVLGEWRIQRHLTLTAAYAHFFAGSFLDESTPGKDVDYVSTWLTFKF